MAAAAEERSNHPLAHAVIHAAKERGLNWQPAEDAQVLPGRGLTARVEGHDCMLGNEALFKESGIALPGDVAAPEPGVTRLWMALDGTVAGYFDARDALRPDAAEAIAELRSEGLRVMMLTGDSAAAAAPIAEQAGITEVEAGLDPAGKLRRIRELQKSGLKVAMVGDGINDAAALAQADAGIAMGGGADLAQEAGDVLLLRTQPSAIPAALELARETRAHHAAEPGLGSGLQRDRDSAGRGAAVSSVSHSADAVAGGGGDGAELSVRAGEQLAAAGMAAEEQLLAISFFATLLRDRPGMRRNPP